MAEKHGVFESTFLNGCVNFSFVNAAKDIENGGIVFKGAQIAKNEFVYNAIIPTTAAIATAKAYVVGNPAWSYDTSSVLAQNEENFINEKGARFRVYELKSERKFTVSANMITGATITNDSVVGQYVTAQDGTEKMKISVALPTTAFIGKIVAVEKRGLVFDLGDNTVDQTIVMVTIEVVANGND